MSDELDEIREQFIEAMRRMTHFWGFGETTGSVYGAIYLSPTSLSLDDLAAQTGLDQETIWPGLRLLEQINLIRRQAVSENGPDHFTAETDFWQVARTLMAERKESEFGLGVQQVGESLARATAVSPTADNAELAAFYQTRLQTMNAFFDSLDRLITLLTTLDDLRLNALLRFFGNNRPTPNRQS